MSLSLLVHDNKIFISEGIQIDLRGQDLSDLISYWETGVRVSVVASQSPSGESSLRGETTEDIAEWVKESLGPQPKSAPRTKVLSYKL